MAFRWRCILGQVEALITASFHLQEAFSLCVFVAALEICNDIACNITLLDLSQEGQHSQLPPNLL